MGHNDDDNGKHTKWVAHFVPIHKNDMYINAYDESVRIKQEPRNTSCLCACVSVCPRICSRCYSFYDKSSKLKMNIYASVFIMS